MSVTYISIDDWKKEIAGYMPERAQEFHRESARLADKQFETALKNKDINEVILLCGGSASGKTEFAETYLKKRHCIVFDSTLSSIEGATIKMRKIAKAKKKPIIIAVFPDDIGRSFDAFLGRKRQFDEKHFYRTHAGSRQTLLWIAKEHPEVAIKLYESTYRDDVIRFTDISFQDHARLVAFLQSIQYSTDELANDVQSS
ncbi:MAG: hypothetical protein PHZ00_00445 [Candidatus Peribacteraceae bacterium]|nr:hypothetical protein [Candidatus Peribacteraceae bacterium]